MDPLARLIWSTICEVAGKHHHESLVIGPTRATLQAACRRVQEKLGRPDEISKDLRGGLKHALQEACNNLDRTLS